jgi:hypothetical protein
LSDLRTGLASAQRRRLPSLNLTWTSANSWFYL